MATNKAKVQTYISKSHYEALRAYADERDISISEAASILLQTVLTSPVDAFGESSMIQDYVTREEMVAYVQSELGRLAGTVENELENFQTIVGVALRQLAPAPTDRD
jgi:hypothetical protein